MNPKLVIYLMLFVLAFTNSCIKGPDQDAIDRVENLLKSGSWRVTKFKVENEEKMSMFLLYDFTFNEDNTIVATDGIDTQNGWLYVYYNDPNTVVGLSFYSNTAGFQAITNDYVVISQTDSKLEMDRSDNSSGTPVEWLTFEKN
jgi:hypothetical protein